MSRSVLLDAAQHNRTICVRSGTKNRRVGLDAVAAPVGMQIGLTVPPRVTNAHLVAHVLTCIAAIALTHKIAGRIAGGRAAVRAIRSNTSCSARSNPSPGLAHHAAGAKMPAAHSCPWSIQAVRSLLDAHLFDRTQYKGDTNGLGQYIDLAFERRANLRAGGFIEGIVVARDHGIGPFDVVGRIHNRNDIVTPRRAPQSRVTLVGHEPRQPREQPCIVAKLAHLDLRNVSALLTSRKPELTPAEHRSARNSSHSLLDELSDPNSIALKQCENSFRRLADLGSIEPLR